MTQVVFIDLCAPPEEGKELSRVADAIYANTYLKRIELAHKIEVVSIDLCKSSRRIEENEN